MNYTVSAVRAVRVRHRRGARAQTRRTFVRRRALDRLMPVLCTGVSAGDLAIHLSASASEEAEAAMQENRAGQNHCALPRYVIDWGDRVRIWGDRL